MLKFLAVVVGGGGNFSRTEGVEQSTNGQSKKPFALLSSYDILELYVELD